MKLIYCQLAIEDELPRHFAKHLPWTVTVLTVSLASGLAGLAEEDTRHFYRTISPLSPIGPSWFIFLFAHPTPPPFKTPLPNTLAIDAAGSK